MKNYNISKSWLSSVVFVLLFAIFQASNVLSANPQVEGGVDTSKWRGFNLLEKFTVNRNSPFVENDFKWISELGFNFVRLPLDYRCYVEQTNWLVFKESVLKEIDQAIEYGKKYNIHVCINLHRAPGFCINPPAEPLDLWTSDEALNAFVEHWKMFARRYKGIPNERLSFNLLNEPSGTKKENYLKVFMRAIEEIHKIDPDRLIIVDGMNVGRDPVPEFLPLKNVMQATRGYHPGTISHYKASWVRGSDAWPEPVWPDWRPQGYLYGPIKPEFKSPLVLNGDFKPGTEIGLKLARISGKVTLRATAEGKTLEERVFNPDAQTNDWEVDTAQKQFKQHIARNNLRFAFTISQPIKVITIENIAGDWITFSEIQIKMPNGQTKATKTDLSWGRKQQVYNVSADGTFLPPPDYKSNAPLLSYLKPWIDISQKGEAVFVGEWGCFNKTPHNVALAWMKDWLELWKENKFGWALWNFRGSFGILDSGRADVDYEDWNGHKLDRKMLNLLQQYLKY